MHIKSKWLFGQGFAGTWTIWNIIKDQMRSVGTPVWIEPAALMPGKKSQYLELRPTSTRTDWFIWEKCSSAASVFSSIKWEVRKFRQRSDQLLESYLEHDNGMKGKQNICHTFKLGQVSVLIYSLACGLIFGAFRIQSFLIILLGNLNFIRHCNERTILIKSYFAEVKGSS